MLLLPVPIVVALVLAFLLLRAVLRGEGHPMLRALIAACAAQSVLVALVQHYGIAALRPVQPVTATLLPPLAWLAFVAVSQRPLSLARDAAHALAPAAALAALVVAPAALDLVIVGAFAGYGASLLRATVGEGAALPGARLESGDVPHVVWRLVGAALLASALGDLLIAADGTLGEGAWRGPIVSLSGSAVLLAIGALALSRDIDPPAPGDAPDAPPPAPDPQEATRDAALIARLERLLDDDGAHLDPDLTLARLARKLGAPAKTLSGAINRTYGESVSRVVNRRRIAHAAALLEGGAPVTRAMLESGFNTKSNFNREFGRLKGMSPTAWLAARRDAGGLPLHGDGRAGV